ncbi:DegT/DnrJ/EryC1/StrS aminotransferase family protein [Nitzschia inconspicua]|uniref:DegT/DnrJ/EryC1/StrS aminotransferase family protein n=1 Tax=Nitzschia inconspicua TaxID=303405 RepID=A0A9K3KKV9_9STRA|nr:DegT/DnrJ/EryC1/StrS aminotransferase family protein [Nitzschia inconspicua]
MEAIGTFIGMAASTVAVLLWLLTFHKRFFISIVKTEKVAAYGVYTEWGEACRTHFWYLIKALFPGNSPSTQDRLTLERQVQEAFHQQFGSDQGGNVLIAHSCRSIFYYVIRYFLSNAKEVHGRRTIRICLPSLHFGSFYRIIRGIEKSLDCCIELYEVDLNENDWTLDQDSVDEEEFKKCDLLMCQHLFGLPLNQDRLVKMARKFDIPILEDCVQSGSLFGKYRGYAESDIIMYSGGLDKTPPCFGGGFGFFRNTPWGMKIYEHCNSLHNALPLDTWQGRFMTCFNIMVHLMIAKDSFGFNSLMGLVSYVWLTERGDYINWYAMSLKVRKAKAITPFQHTESGFLRRPSAYQLQSMLYGLSRKERLKEVAQHEFRSRELLLSTIPPKYHRALFPWMTAGVLEQYKEMQGVSEFSWVVSPIGDRMHLCQFLNDHFIVVMINTTWEANEKSKSAVGKCVNDNLIYLPNINEATDELIVRVGKALTMYCQDLEKTGEVMF